MEPAFRDLATGLGLGLLVGLQRQRQSSRLAGIRTFPLATLLGTVAALLAPAFGGWLLAAGALCIALLTMAGNRAKLQLAALQNLEPDPGLTTEVALLLMFGVGAMLPAGLRAEAVAIGGGVAVLLHLKRPLHAAAERIGEADAQAVFRFALLALVVLPVLPDRAFGPYAVLNPFRIWLMVVLIVGISLAAYVASRLLGPRGGTLAAGLLGGLISSTATTVSYAGRTRRDPELARSAAAVILLASTVVFVRVLFEIALVAPTMLPETAPPLLVMMMLLAGLSFVAVARRAGAEGVAHAGAGGPPSNLAAAMAFGVLYALVLVAVAAAKEHLGPGAVFAVAALSGLTDMDAITLSTAEMVRGGRIEASHGWRLILVGALTNLVFKGLVVAALGHRKLLVRVGGLMGVGVAGGLLLLAVWP